MSNNELQHHGVKGMKWGVRKTPKHEDYVRVHKRKSIKKMSDAELRSRNNRLQMEQQYKQLTKRTNYGKKAVQGFIKGAGTITAAVGAYAIYKKYGAMALDKIGDAVVRNIKL